jgi:rubrerythrin
MSALTPMLARVTAPFAFLTRRRTAKQLFRFALAEQESMLELRAAAARCPNPERRAMYLRHALDEERHATAFAAHAGEIRRSLGLPAWGHPRTDCEGLYDRLGEEGFLAFVHRGEHRGRVQFEAYMDYFERRGDVKLRALFNALIGDERGHESYTRELLVSCAGGERPARRLLWKMAFWEGFRVWRRAGQGLAQLVYGVSMTVLYVTLLPFAIVLRLTRPAERGGWR